MQERLRKLLELPEHKEWEIRQIYRKLEHTELNKEYDSQKDYAEQENQKFLSDVVRELKKGGHDRLANIVSWAPLKGQPFINEKSRITNPEDSCFGNEYDRICNLCEYRYQSDDCRSHDRPTPKETFETDPYEVMPKIINGKDVGNYCPRFHIFAVE